MAAQPPLVTAAWLLAQRRGRGRELARSRSGSRCGVGEGRGGGSVAVRGPRRRSCTRELGATASGARGSAEPALGLWERGGAEDRRVGRGRGRGEEGALARGGSARFGRVCARACSGLGGRAQGWRDSCPPAGRGCGAGATPHTRLLASSCPQEAKPQSRVMPSKRDATYPDFLKKEMQLWERLTAL